MKASARHVFHDIDMQLGMQRQKQVYSLVLPIYTRFDVGRSAILISQHLLNPCDLIFGWNDQRDHACAVPRHHNGGERGLEYRQLDSLPASSHQVLD